MFNEEDLPKLKKLGVKDSKLLLHKKRIKLAEEIKKIAVKIKIIKITPQEIDNAVFRDNGLNLNWLEARKQAEIINKLKPDEAVIDCPSPNIKAFTNYLFALLTHKPKLVIEHKADRNFIQCSSASVLAKCKREEEVEEIEKLVGQSIGTGYSSNPVCQKFLKDNFEKYPDIIRKSWSTFRDLNNKKSQKTLNNYQDK